MTMRLIALMSAALTLPLGAAPRLHVAPTPVAAETKIEIVFDKEVCTPEQVGQETDEPWLRIQPGWSGKTVWKETNVLGFIPDEVPALGITYQFTLLDGRRHQDGSEIPGARLGNASTPNPGVEVANLQNRWSNTWSARTAVHYVAFNGEVDPAEAASFIGYQDKDGRRINAKVRRATFGDIQQTYYIRQTYAERFALRLAGRGDNREWKNEDELLNGLMIEPATPLPVGKGWNLVLREGLPVEGRPMNAERTESLGDVELPQLTGVRAQTVADQPRRIVVQFNRALTKEIDPALIRVEPELADMEVSVHGNSLRIDGDFSGRDQWTVEVNRRVRSFDDLTLEKNHRESVEFKHLAAGIALPTNDDSQLASGSRFYRLLTVNVDSVQVRIKRLEGSQLVRGQQGYRYYTGRGPDGKRLNPERLMPYELMEGDTIADFEVVLDNAIDTSRELYLDWDKVIAGDPRPYVIDSLPEEPREGGGVEPGAFFIEVVATPKSDANPAQAKSAQALVQLTDLGMAWKLAEDEARAFVFSCRTGKPIEGVRVQLFGEDAKPIQDAVTGPDGLVTLPRDASMRHLRASLGKDQFMTPYDNAMPRESMWRFPVRHSWYEEPMEKRRIMLFSDRSLYRPGEEVHVKGLLRRQHGNDILAHGPDTVRFTVTNPTGVEIIAQDVEISAAGSFDHSFHLPAETVGGHIVSVGWPDEVTAAEAMRNWNERRLALDNAQQTLWLRVEEFRRNAFEISHDLTDPAPGATEVELNVGARNFSGQAIAGAAMETYSRSSEVNFYPERYRDYLFGNHRRQDNGYWYHYFGYDWGDGSYWGGGETADSVSTELDEQGAGTVTVKLPESEFPMAREVTIQTEVTDNNRQTLNRLSRTRVDPASVYLGVRRVDRLVRVGDKLPLELVAVDPAGHPYEGELEITTKLTREVNEQVRMQTEQGGAVRNETRIEELGGETLKITGDEPSEYVFAPEKTGLHTLELRGTDAAGKEFATAVSMHVYGTREYPWAYEDNMRIRLVPEKQIYRPGDVARLLVLSPIEGTALVTVERETVSRSFIIELDPANPVIELPLTDDDAPNCFVSVMVIKGADDSLRKFKEPQLRLGYCELMVENLRDRLTVEFTEIEGERSSSDAGVEMVSLMPGSGVVVEGRVLAADGQPAAGAEVTLYAEDEGTLAVVGYTTPNPMAFFYDPRLLRVRSGTSLGMFLRESPDQQSLSNKGFFIGGGDGDGADPWEDTRRDFNPCAFWMPSVITDAEGRFRIESGLPDTLTRYRLIAVVHHEAARFGHAEDAFLVNKPLMLEPQVPRFASEGDRLTMRATVSNSSNLDGEWKISLLPNAPGDEPIVKLRPGVSDSVMVRIPAGGSETVRFDVDFRNTGEALMKWRAEPVKLAGKVPTADQLRQHADAVESVFPVEYPAPLLRQTRLVHLGGGDDVNDLLAGFDPALLNGRGHIEVEFSRSLLLEAAGAIHYLLRYPYGCLEQTTSSLIPWLAVEGLRNGSPELAKRTPEEVEKAIRMGVERLLSMQHRDGGFGYWPGARETSRWSGSFAGMALVMASDQVNVPEDAINRHADYLIKQLREINDRTNPENLEIAARDLWVLAMAKKPQESYVSLLRNRMPQLTLRARCFLAMAEAEAGRGGAARQILQDQTEFIGEEGSWMRWQPDDALQLLAWSKIDRASPQVNEVLKKMIGDRNPYGHWRTTWMNSWSLLALAAYAEGDELKATTLELTAHGETESITVDQDNPGASRTYRLGKDLQLGLRSDGFAYARVTVAAKPEITPLEPVSVDGLEVTRFYHRVNADGTSEPLDVPKIGDLVRVDLRVTLPKDNARYLVIEDRLPGNFEAVNTTFGSQAANMNAGFTSERAWNISHSEIRADRVNFFLDRPGYRGTHTLSYLARVTMEGSSFAPPAKVEPMYDPEQRALSASRRFEVAPAP